MAKVPISGPTAGSTPVDGRSTKCMAAEPSHGLMDVSTLVTTLMTKNKVSELSLGPTIDSMTASGSTVNKKA